MPACRSPLRSWFCSAFWSALSLAALAIAPAAVARLWSAQWIVCPDAPARDEAVYHFRKVLELPAKPSKFLVHVTADNRFVLYVNGSRAGTGPSRSDLAHWRYETFDLAPFLREGKNILSATVWNFGARTALAQISDRTAFLLAGTGEAEKIADTNASWEVSRDAGLQTEPPPQEVRRFYLVSEPSLRLDASRWDWDANADAASRFSWRHAVSIGGGMPRGDELQNNNWQLVPDPLPPMEMKLEPAGRVVRFTGVANAAAFPESAVIIPAGTTAAILIDNGHLTTAYPELTVSGGSGASVQLTYAEALFDKNGEKGNRNEIEGKHIVGMCDEFLPDGAAQRVFSPLVWRTWRYLQIDVTTGAQPVTLEKLREWFTAFPFQDRAKFRSGDAQLEQIWEIGWRTARLDAHDTYMDTPYWEQMQYIGDTRLQALISYSVAGDDRLARQAMDAFDESRIPEGLTRSRYPSSVTQIIPPFSWLWVGMVHDFWEYRGDAEFVRSHLPGMRAVLEWTLRQQRTDGLLGKLPWWPFADWGKDFAFGDPPQDADGGSAILTLQFVAALRDEADLESQLGDAERAAEYRQAADRAAKAVGQLCWNENYGLLADTPAQNHFSQHANILGAWLDVIPRERQKEVLTKILSVSDAGFSSAAPVPPMTTATYYFRFYLARALEHAGMADDYLRLLGPWKQMISLGLTTWAEQPEPTRSDSHAWSAHPNYDLLRLVAGIQPASPGFATVRIEPHLGPLRQLDAIEPTPKGDIAVSYSVSGGGVSARVALPAGVSGELAWHGNSYRLHERAQMVVLPFPVH